MSVRVFSRTPTISNVKRGDVIYLDKDIPENYWEVLDISTSVDGITKVIIVKVGKRSTYPLGYRSYTFLQGDRWFFAKSISKIYVKEREEE